MEGVQRGSTVFWDRPKWSLKTPWKRLFTRQGFHLYVNCSYLLVANLFHTQAEKQIFLKMYRIACFQCTILCRKTK